MELIKISFKSGKFCGLVICYTQNISEFCSPPLEAIFSQSTSSFREGGSGQGFTASLGNPFQCLIALSLVLFFLLPTENFPCYNLWLLSFHCWLPRTAWLLCFRHTLIRCWKTAARIPFRTQFSQPPLMCHVLRSLIITEVPSWIYSNQSTSFLQQWRVGKPIVKESPWGWMSQLTLPQAVCQPSFCVFYLMGCIFK